VSLFGTMASTLWTVGAFLVVLSIVVFIHELGHFLVARWCRVKVSEFSIGFGREIAGFNDRYGTRWRINWLPLGGYVKFFDDLDGASIPDAKALERMTPEEREGSFHAKPLWQKAAVIVAGPMANFLLAIAVLAGIFMTVGIAITLPKVDEVVAGGAADRAGLRSGDLITAIDGVKIETFTDLQRIVSGSPDIPLKVDVSRGGQTFTVTVTPQRTETPDGFGGKMRVGMLGVKRNTSAVEWSYKKFGPIDAVGEAVNECIFFVSRNLSYLRDVIFGKEKVDQLRGPIGIAEVVGKTTEHGLLPIIHLLAILSLSIGLFNLFPIPPLDGGHLMFYAYEAIRGRPMNNAAQGVGFRIGLVMILMLAVVATWNDALRIIGRLIGS